MSYCLICGEFTAVLIPKERVVTGLAWRDLLSIPFMEISRRDDLSSVPSQVRSRFVREGCLPPD